MTIGTGIFASTLLLVLAFAAWKATKHQRWKAVLKACAIVVCVSGVLGVGIWQIDEYNERPVPQTELEGVVLGMTQADVKIAKGSPSSETSGEKDKAPAMFYKPLYGDGILLVIFSDPGNGRAMATKVCRISDPPPVNGIHNYMGERQVIERLGAPDASWLADDQLSKFMLFSKWKMQVEIEKGSVHSICVVSLKQPVTK
jgi:hypothetical protein